MIAGIIAPSETGRITTEDTESTETNRKQVTDKMNNEGMNNEGMNNEGMNNEWISNGWEPVNRRTGDASGEIGTICRDHGGG